jgi:CubicO group peptidase (beta-lactamase class C family)
MATTFPTDWRTAVDSFVTDWLSDQRIPGAALAVVDNDSLVYAEGYGARDLDTNAPATVDTLYGVASVTKSFTALSILQQVERTALDLADPVTDYLSFYDDLADPPTIHELLCHSSGMPSDGTSVALIARLTGEASVEVPLSSENDLQRHIAGTLDDRAETDRFFYYNTGYTVLGKLVAVLDGRPFPQYIDEEILDPLDMTRSHIAPASLGQFDDVMTPYRTENDDRVETTFPVKGVGAAGGLLTSVTDLSNYLSFQFDGTSELISPDLLDEAHTAHATRQTYLDGTEQGYGYGWMTRPFLGDTLIEHGGSLGVSTAYVGYLDDADVGVAIACNDAPEIHPQFVGPAVLATLYGEDPADATRFYALREKAAHVAGTYESHRGIQTATITPTGSRIEVTLETALSEDTFEAYPDSTDIDDLVYYTIKPSGARVPLEFTDDDGLALRYQRWHLNRTDR